jgi:phosphate transport system protein
MGEVTLSMFSDSINAFISEDPNLARSVCERDNIVDKLGDDILKASEANMEKEPAVIEKSLNIMRIAQNLERIADLSTNVCEDVIYLSLGRVIKHHKGSEEACNG